MGRREPIAETFAAERAAAQLAGHEFASVQVRIRSLLQEARVLREEAMALRDAPHRFGDQLRRRGLLHHQALLCSTEAIKLLRIARVR